MNRKKLTLLLKVSLLLLMVIGLAGLRTYLQKKEEEAADSAGYAKTVSERDPLFKEYRKRYPDRTVLLACSEDITNNGKKDLVVISQLDNEITAMALLDDGEGSITETEPIPAPRENQHIRFVNIDGTGGMETLITGEKNGQVGYAIYRIMNGRMVNLYGEGMEDCC